jgi:hypothetical protein
MLHEGKVNLPTSPIADGDGAVCARMGKWGEHLQSRHWPDHSHPTYRKYNFHATCGSVTIGAGHVSPCTANTGTPILGHWNPPNSGVHCHIVKHSCHTISGTPGGPLVWNYFVNQTITGAPNHVPVCGFVGGAACRTLWFINTALTGCSTGLLLKHAWRFTATAAAYSDGQPDQLDDGDIIIPPGCAFGLFAFAAGTSHVVQASCTFAEYPI